MKIKRSDIALFLFPTTILTIVYFAGPLLFMCFISLTDWNGGNFDIMKFVGLNNFAELFKNMEYWETLKNTFIWCTCSIVILMPVALIIAMILARKPRGHKWLKTVYFFPQVVAPLSLAYMWQFIFNQDIGIINNLFRKIGLNSWDINWLGEPKFALGALIFAWVLNIGCFMVIFLSQIGTIPDELFEAATVDGASKISQDWHITLPLLKGTIATCVLLSVTWTFKAFEIPFILTNGGPGTSSQILPIMMYKRFIDNQSGMSNAIGMTMVILGVVMIYVVKKVFSDKTEGVVS